MREIKVFAPGTVANLGPGFDVLGLALERPGDTVVARSARAPGVRIVSLDDDLGTIPVEAERNTAGIAAIEVLKRSGSDAGFELSLTKGMPSGSGLGSSAASAAAAAVAVNELLDKPLAPEDLIACCVEAEAAVSGRHADNVAPSVLGGCVLVRSVDPLDVQRLPVPDGLHAVVVTPGFELSTRRAREALPRTVPLQALVRNNANLAALIHAFHTADLELLGRALRDERQGRGVDIGCELPDSRERGQEQQAREPRAQSALLPLSCICTSLIDIIDISGHRHLQSQDLRSVFTVRRSSRNPVRPPLAS